VTAKMAADRKKLFRLREYDKAFRNVFSRVIRLRAEEAYPLLKEIPTEPRPAIHTSQVTLPSGEALTNEPFEMKVAFRFSCARGHTQARLSALCFGKALIDTSTRITSGWPLSSRSTARPRLLRAIST